MGAMGAEEDDGAWFAGQIERHRPRLRALAYRMLGSEAEADDALQEAWLRARRASAGSVHDVTGWLLTVVGRVCVDMLRARGSRPAAAGPELPEPMVATGDGGDPEHAALLGDSVGLALLVVLDALTPAERLAFVLHDLFGVPFDEIAPLVDRSPAAARQLASRARRRVRGRPTVPDADLPAQREVVEAFLAAARGGDVDALLRLLDPDVVLRTDAGPRRRRAPAVLHGADSVAARAAAVGPRFATRCRAAVVHGAAGVVARSRGGRLLAVAGTTVVGGRIVEIDLVLDPRKLAEVEHVT